MSKNLCLFVLTLLAGLLLTGCGPSEVEMQATQTQLVASVLETQTASAPTKTPHPTVTVTPSPTPTLTPTPTDTPTPAPTATPDYSTITLFESDLPDDYKARNPALFGFNDPGIDGNWGMTISSFVFMNGELGSEGRFIIGFVEHLPDPRDQNEFDYAMDVLAELFLQGIAMGIGSEEVEDLSLLEGIDSVGDARAGRTGVFNGEMRIDTLVFRRGPFIAVIFEFYPPGQLPDSPIGALGEILDSRMKYTFGGAANCSDPIGCVYVGPGDPVHIAYMLAVYGAVSTLGEDSRGGIEIAIADRNGMLLDHPILLTGEDSGCSAGTGQAAAFKIIQDSTVLGIIGTNCSSAAFAALPTINQAGLVMISPSNTNPGLTDPDQGWYPGYFRTIHNDLIQGKLAAQFAFEQLGVRTAATVHDNSRYSEGLQAEFARVFTELGGTITFRGSVDIGTVNMQPLLENIAAGTPEALYFPIFEPEGAFLVNQVGSIPGLEEALLISADGLLIGSFGKNAGGNAVGVYLTGPYVAGEAYDVFLTRWQEIIGGSPPSGFHAHAYDATNMLLDAIERAAIRDEDGGLLIGRSALRTALEETKDFQGLIGTLTCSKYGDCGTLEALAVFLLGEDEVFGENWPPPVFYTP